MNERANDEQKNKIYEGQKVNKKFINKDQNKSK